MTACAVSFVGQILVRDFGRLVRAAFLRARLEVLARCGDVKWRAIWHKGSAFFFSITFCTTIHNQYVFAQHPIERGSGGDDACRSRLDGGGQSLSVVGRALWSMQLSTRDLVSGHVISSRGCGSHEHYAVSIVALRCRSVAIQQVIAWPHAGFGLSRLNQPVDVLILETMSSVDQARGALMGAGLAGKPIWLALSVDDDDGTKLRSNEALADIGPLITEFAPERVLLNCSRPEAVSEGLPILAKLHPHVGAYANGFTRIAAEFDHIGATTDLLSKRQDLGPAAYAAFAQDWVAAGRRMQKSGDYATIADLAESEGSAPS